MLGKHTRLPFYSSSHRAKHPFDLIHLDLLTSLVISVSGSKSIWLFLMILLIIYELFPWNLNLTPSLLCPISLVMCLLSSAGLSKLSSATTDVSLITLPPESSSCRTTHSSGCRVFTRPHKMVKLNVLFVRLTMSSALCWFRLPFPGVTGQKGFTLLRTC
jgi:hypothetical protein